MMNNHSEVINKIAYCRIPGEIDPVRWSNLISSAPGTIQKTIHKYFKTEDQYRFLAGRLLLKYLLNTFFSINDPDILNKIQFGENGRPFIPCQVDFNISHSGNLVICAAATGKIGIDVEWIRPIDIDEFNQTLSENQRRLIGESPDPLKMFYRIWAAKESVIKLTGDGIQMPLNEIHSDFTTANFNDKSFFLYEINIDPHYTCFLASHKKDEDYLIRENELEVMLSDM